MPCLKIGSRGSELALWQAHYVADRLRLVRPDIQVEIEVVKTKGDRVLDVALSKIGDKGLFTKELEQALLDGRVDVCVHSMKDVPTVLPEGLVLAGCLERADARDALVAVPGATFASLPSGARVGTGALRRLAQLRAVRDDLEYMEVRGNLDTRIAKVRDGSLDAIVLAAAGIKRMGWEREIVEAFPVDVVVPAVGQGAIGLEIRADDEAVARVCALVCDAVTNVCVTAERCVMRALDGGCQVPLGAYARFEGPELVLDAFAGRLDGTLALRSRLRTKLSQPGCLVETEQAVREARALALAAVEDLESLGARAVLDEARVAGDERRLA
ncbi:hydroxymethylbilane synthase [Paraeggerthella hongkongensis]|uniref:hydroxymethylbilane synthase n=1 Tax=Paraeggerthella hominis TaxID=2897351 RepID=UPI001C102DBD|nr:MULTISPECIES: hydroxymethylbilane synthase [Paraeggerthella]MBU5405783.1 hydroxymethylbilane synthase [Paraeggerthella hongkongensis]MCD2433630.1 hydroxymethylbilane synthase [Paraeggerthella hominis]